MPADEAELAPELAPELDRGRGGSIRPWTAPPLKPKPPDPPPPPDDAPEAADAAEAADAVEVPELDWWRRGADSYGVLLLPLPAEREPDRRLDDDDDPPPDAEPTLPPPEPEPEPEPECWYDECMGWGAGEQLPTGLPLVLGLRY